MIKETKLDFPRLASERLKKLVKSLMEPSKKVKSTRTFSIDYEGSLVFSFREGKLKPIDIQDLSQFFTENYGEAFRAFLEMDGLLADNRKLVLRKHLSVYNYNRKTKEWCLVRSESGGLGCWDKSKHQDDKEKVNASGWTEEQILTKGDKFTTPYTEGVQTYAGLAEVKLVKKEQADDQ